MRIVRHRLHNAAGTCAPPIGPVTIPRIFGRWRGSAYTQHQLDALLGSVARAATADEKKAWLIDLFAWIRGGAGLMQFGDDARAAKRAVRVRFLLAALARTPAAAAHVQALIADVLRDCDPVDLFAEGGLPHSDSLWQELKERLLRRWLPRGTAGHSLLALFGQLFPSREDPAWLEALDTETLDGIEAQLGAAGIAVWLREACEDALRYLVAQVRATGLSTPLRLRIDRPFRELPFLRLDADVASMLAARQAGGDAELVQQLNVLRGRIDECRDAVREAYAHLDQYGVNTHVVFQLSGLDQQLERIERLVDLEVGGGETDRFVLAFVRELVRGQEDARSIGGFFRQSTALLAKKLVERNAETGEHYIARDRAEYLAMLKSAAGGGALTAITVTLKFAIGSLHLPRLAEGLLSACNYAGSFVVMQFCGATLATKQPAATATTLAAQMTDLVRPDHVDLLVDEIVYVVRSQIAAITGNLLLVIPCVLALDVAWVLATGHHQLDALKAQATLDSLSVVGPTLIYAAFTGVLLWVSSLAAGWADNWFAMRQIGENMLTNRRLQIVLGARRLDRLVKVLHRHAAGFAGNVTLGLLLALVPAFADTLGLPLDVRHVTLSTGSVAAAIAALGASALATPSFVYAVIGIAGIGMLNLGVSFYLALQVALRARGVPRVEKRLLYRRLARLVLTQPQRLVWPDRTPRPPSPRPAEP